MDGVLSGTHFRVVVCVQTPCHRPAQNPGDVITIFPLSGTNVYSIPDLNRVNSIINSLEQGNLNVNFLSILNTN